MSPTLITKTLSSSFQPMTKELVDALLALNTKNRNQRATVVATYKRAMARGLWVPTNQGIGVAANGFLVDGQHRLEALRDAGYPAVVMLLVTGLSDEALAAVDGGSNRTPKDYLKFMFDTKISAQVSAMLRASMLAADGFSVATRYQPQEFAAHLEKMGESIDALMGLERATKLPAAVLAALMDAHSKGYEEEGLSFAKALLTGEMLERNNPALLLRNWLATDKGSGGSTSLVERYTKTTRALQAWVDQKPIGKLYRTRSPIAAQVRKGA